MIVMIKIILIIDNDDDVNFGEWQASSLFLQSLHDTRNFKITYPYD